MHEVEFCAQVKSWLDTLFASHPEWPFDHAAIEQYGSGSTKRSDLRIYARDCATTPCLTGEVKMPGTMEGRTPLAPSLMKDAEEKAGSVKCRYFFTWNVQTFVLFDRSRWEVPIIERRIRHWDLKAKPRDRDECARSDVTVELRDKFLPEIFEFFANILQEKITDWGEPPDAIFITSLEGHLAWPVDVTTKWLETEALTDKPLKTRLQAWMAQEMGWSFDPDDAVDWHAALDRAARTLCYVFSNQIIFYEALRAKYPDRLTELHIPKTSREGAAGIRDHFRHAFQNAVRESGDYESIFAPQMNDWAASLIFAAPETAIAWAAFLTNLTVYNFQNISKDIIGGIFQRLISPEERQRFGQFFTHEDVIDVINAFCIRRAGDTVLDPSCGSGSFLVRAYHRKAWLSVHRHGGGRHQDHDLGHSEILREIFGCDISHFAAHLATLNLAARHIEDEENYPCIARRNFFDVPRTPEAFCELPGGLRDSQGRRRRLPVPLPKLDAIVGNPPYVRQEKIPKLATVKREPGEPKAAYEARCRETKEYLLDTCRGYWPGVTLSGRSDLHCYFWPVAAGLLKDNGWFGFLTSSSWLDVEYGFDLQRWILENFKLVAVMESLDEPWFSDARIKTAVTILQRCNNQVERDANTVRFVRLLKPLRDILGLEKTNDEGARQQAAERLRDLILKTGKVVANDQVRIVPVPQRQLWEEGVRAAELLRRQPAAAAEEDDADETTGIADSATTDYGAAAELAPVLEIGEAAAAFQAMQASPYAAGKWGRFLRAPDIYFRLLERCASRFVRLGEITEVRRGITSGCDDFFMPHDVTARTLEKAPNDLAWNEVGLITPCKRREVAKGKLRIIEAGDGTLHPVEAEYLRPEVHSLMQVDRPVVRAADTDRVVLWVDQPLDELGSCFAAKYIRWGAKQTFASKKSKPVPLPQRSTCEARKLWYDVTGIGVGFAFWPMAQQYRHIIPANPEGNVCNHNLFYLRDSQGLGETGQKTLAAILNSTIVGLSKCFFGRYAGTEAALKTEVIDVTLMTIPDPRGISPELAGRLAAALERMSARKVTGLVEERLMLCRDPEQMREILKDAPELPTELRQADRHDLDDAVLELLGVTTAKERKQLLAELYAETTLYFRRQRVMEIQGMCNRAKTGRRGMEPGDMAAILWDVLRAEHADLEPVAVWLVRNFSASQQCHIPEGHAKAVGAGDMFNANAVLFKSAMGSRQLDCANPEQAALVAQLATVGVRGDILLPADPRACTLAGKALEQRLAQFRKRFTELAASRAGDQALREKIIQTLVQWLTHGRK